MEFSYCDAPVWPAFVKPQKDELLSSWITRIAHSHLLKVHTFCNILWPKTQIWNRDVDRIDNKAIFNLIGTRTFTSSETVNNTLLSSYEGFLFEKHTNLTNQKWIMPLGIYHRTRLKFGLMICPQCLKKDGANPFYRKQWRLSLYVCCVACKCMLAEKCPQCLAPINFFRAELGHKTKTPSKDLSITKCDICQLDFTTFTTEKASPDVLAFQINNDKILREGYCEYTSYSHLYFRMLHQLAVIISSKSPRSDLIRSEIGKGMGIDFTFSFTYSGTVFDSLDLKSRANIFLMANWLLEDWPKRFHDFYKSTFHNSLLFQEIGVIPFWFKRYMGYESV